jgi:hypothetical protein
MWGNKTISGSSSKKRKGDSSKQGGRSSTSNKKGKRSCLSLDLDLPQVDFRDLALGKELGIGRNGSTFKVSWGGKQAAVKQFHIGEGGRVGLKKELCAYARTRCVWGTLVPEPLFLSQTPSGGVILLGLQLGRSLRSRESENKNILKQWASVIATLEEDFGIRHNDAEGNALIVTTKGTEHLVAIDFEDWDDVL